MDKLMKMCLVMALLSVPCFGYIVADWEGTPDNAKHWPSDPKVLVDDASVMPGIYGYSTIGATSGSQSLKVTTGTGGTYDVYQYLALDLTFAQRQQLMNHATFSIDFTVAANSSGGGRMQIYEIVLNTNAGWQAQTIYSDLSSGNLYFDLWGGSPQRTMTVSFDYDAAALNGGNAPDWTQIVISVQDGGAANPDFYFDNARLTGVPEPATLTLLALGAATLLRRRK